MKKILYYCHPPLVFLVGGMSRVFQGVAIYYLYIDDSYPPNGVDKGQHYSLTSGV